MDKLKRDQLYIKYLKINPNNEHELIPYGFTPTQYYCGNHKLQKRWTNIVRNKLMKRGYMPIYNKACFKHDLLYGLVLTRKEKEVVDKMFLGDMFDLFITHNKNIGWTRRSIWQFFRMMMFYKIVRWFEPIYILMGLVKKDGRKKD